MIPAKQEMEVKMAEKLRITLVKSPIGAVPKHRKTVDKLPGGSDLFGQFFFLTGLWYTETHKTVELPDNAATRGQIQQIGYMLKVEEI